MTPGPIPAGVSGQIDDRLADLTPAERRVAAVVADDPEAVAFGTVAEVAARAGASGATVVRLAAKLGYDGFVALQAAVQADLTGRLRPAAAKIRTAPAGDIVSRTLATEMDNLSTTLSAIDPDVFDRAIALLSGGSERDVLPMRRSRGHGRPTPSRVATDSAGRPVIAPALASDAAGRVLVLSGDASHGIAVLLATELGLLRPGVEQLTGSEVRVARSLAQLQPGDVLVVLDLARYDRWVLQAAQRAAQAGAVLLAVTDSAVSPLAELAEVRFTAAVTGAGPFDSHIGMLALANALVAGVAARRQRSATERLDRVEAAWRESGALVD